MFSFLHKSFMIISFMLANLASDESLLERHGTVQRSGRRIKYYPKRRNAVTP